MDDDRNPGFLREFYQSLRCICHDLFMARARPTAADHIAHPLSSLFAKTTPEDRAGLVNELIDLRADPQNESIARGVDHGSKYAGFLSAVAIGDAVADQGMSRPAPSWAGADGDADMMEWVRLVKEEQGLKELLDKQTGEENDQVQRRLKPLAARKEQLASRMALAGGKK